MKINTWLLALIGLLTITNAEAITFRTADISAGVGFKYFGSAGTACDVAANDTLAANSAADYIKNYNLASGPSEFVQECHISLGMADNPNWGTASLVYVTEVCSDYTKINPITGNCRKPDTDSGKPRAGECNSTNPIHLVTGNKYQSETDYVSIVLSNGLRFERHYNSQAQELHSGLLGSHWRSTYDSHINTLIDPDTSDEIVVHYRADGRALILVWLMVFGSLQLT